MLRFAVSSLSRFASLLPMMLVLTATAMAGTAVPDTVRSEDIVAGAEWHAGVRNYSLENRTAISMPGMTMEIQIRHEAARDGRRHTFLSMMGMEFESWADADSIVQANPLMNTYVVRPNLAEPTGGAAAAGFSADPNSMPFGFDALESLAGLQAGLLLTYEGADTLTMAGEAHPCLVYRHVDEDAGDDSTYWLDAETRLLLRSRTRSATERGEVDLESTFERLSVNRELDEQDMRFRPGPDMVRREFQGELFVKDSLKGTRTELSGLRGLDGSEVAASEFSGRPVLVDFWATWCQPCHKLMPHLHQLQEQFGSELIIVGITQEDRGVVEGFLAKNPQEHRMLLDPEGRLAASLKVANLPTLLLLDGDGVIRQHLVGYQEYDALESAVASVLDADR